MFRRDQNQCSKNTSKVMKKCDKKHNRKTSGNDSEQKKLTILTGIMNLTIDHANQFKTITGKLAM